MTKRFGNVIKGAEEAAALTNYLKYISDPNSRQTKRQKGGTRDNARVRSEELGYLIAFSAPSSISAFTLNFSKTSLEGFAGFQEALVSTKRLTPIAAGVSAPNGSIPIPKGFRPARTSVFVPNGSAEYVQSKITKEYYLKYGGKSHSLPFGGISATEKQEDGEKAVKTALITVGGGKQYFRVSITPEHAQTPF